MTGISRILTLLLGIGAIAAIAIVLTSGSDGYIAKVELPNAYGVRKNSSVKIAGANGGKIKDIEITDRDTALVEMAMKDDVKAIGAGASVTVRPTDLLGERYIALDPGDLTKPQPSGTVIPVSKTKAPVELDNIINLFTPDVRGKMRILINEFGVALNGRGTDFNALLSALPNSIDKANELVKEVGDNNKSLEQVVVKGDTLLRKVNTKRSDFRRLISEADRALTMVSDKRERLGQTLRTAPAALSQLTGTLNNVQSASASLGPAADSLRQAAAPLTATMKNLPDFQNAAKDTLDAAESASPNLTRLGKGATAPIRELRPAARDATTILSEAQPTIDTIERRADKDLLWILQSFSRWTQPRDGLTHQVPANIMISYQYLKGSLDNFLVQGSGGSKTRSKPEPKAKPAPAPAPAPAPETRQDPAPAPKLKLPEIKLPKLPILQDLPGKLKDVPKAIGELPKDLLDTLPKLDKGLKDAVDGLGNRLDGQQQQRKEGSDAMGLFDYLFAP